ncbi:MAG: YfcE family phosphodiesterase [Promethearchaeota archaeon]
MYKILCIGDSHIPIRAKDIPIQIYDKINELIESELFDYTFFTGDLIDFPKLLELLKQKTKITLFKVIGNMDYYYGNRDSPTYQKLDLFFEDKNKITLGLTHGAQIRPRGDHDQLKILAQEKGYNIIISGHTHKEEIFLTKEGILLINPGSVTGAWSFVASNIPSFIEINIDIRVKDINIKLFQLDKKLRELSVLDFYFAYKSNQIYKKY